MRRLFNIIITYKKHNNECLLIQIQLANPLNIEAMLTIPRVVNAS